MHVRQHSSRYVADVVLVGPGSGPAVLTYLVADEQAAMLGRGAPVHVTVRGRPVLGYVLHLFQVACDDPIVPRLKMISDVPPGEPWLSEHELELAEWLAKNWLASLGEAVQAVRPAPLRSRVEKVVRLTDAGMAPDILDHPALRRAPLRRRTVEVLRDAAGELRYGQLVRRLGTDPGDALRELASAGLVEESTVRRKAATPRTVQAASLLEDAVSPVELTPAQQRVVAALREAAATVPIEDLQRRAGVSRSVIEGMARRGIILKTEVPARGRPPSPQAVTPAPEMTADQLAAIAAVRESMGAPAADMPPILLHGVTASGKTEVYLEAIRLALDAGRSALVLVPEIALAAQVVEVLKSRFGSEVAVLHSRLSHGERFDEWQRVAGGQARVAVGARSAVFAPLDDPGVIVIDEEHEPAYKQESNPRYHVVDVARFRAARAGSLLLLSSATPSVESYYEALQGSYRLVTMDRRVSGTGLPEVRIVDMRDAFKKGTPLFSEPLCSAISERLARGEQALLFLNRRGYAPVLLCRDCGHVVRCENCAISLTLHASRQAMLCHHCGYSTSPPLTCPSCAGTRLRTFGVGTERVEAEVRARFPEARVMRMDSDTLSRKGAHERAVCAFRNGEADILVGTQMIAKGLDFPQVTLVGVVSADTSLHIPDFRAAERTFQILAQVAGRAGRGSVPGEVIIQTFTPEHYAVQCAREQDYRAFFDREIQQRQELRYPPFARLVRILASDASEAAARNAVETAADRLPRSSTVDLIGPAPAPIARLRGEYRWHLILRGPSREELCSLVSAALDAFPSSVRSILTVDVDPLSLA